MRNSSLFIAITFVAGIAVGVVGRDYQRGTAQQKRHDADLAAIEKLHREDVAATLSEDPKQLMDLWAEDGVRLEPGKPSIVGKKAIQADNDRGHAAYPNFKVLSYVPDNRQMHISDGWAVEWNSMESKFQMVPDSPPMPFRAKGVRVMKRQSDGTWKFAAVCWNTSEGQ